MISKEKIESLISSKLSTGEYFVVSLDIFPTNRIKLIVDSLKGITIEEIVEFSRAIEHNLDREVEDFDLEVTSPGLGMPLKVIQQYQKNIGREIEVNLIDTNRYIGILEKVDGEIITLLEEKKVKKEDNKKKELIKTEHTIHISEIKTAHIRINF